MAFEGVSLKCKNFGPFGDEPQGFDEIKPINVIIGRNNSGKSSLLDLVEQSITGKIEAGRGHNAKSPEFLFTGSLSAEQFQNILPVTTELHHAGNYQESFRPREQSDRLSRCKIELSLDAGGEFRCVSIPGWSSNGATAEMKLSSLKSHLGKWRPLKANTLLFRRISAERSILPEQLSGDLSMSSDGKGVSSVISRYLLDGDKDHRVIEEKYISDLNEIISPDSSFSRIQSRRGGAIWELAVEEESKGLVPFSRMGSGIKTIVHVLAYLNLMPLIEHRSPDSFIFAFEELENNLHPAVQRRLFNHLRRRALEEKFCLFVTTHSNVVIDMFSNDEHAQLLHVKHDRRSAKVMRVETHSHGCSILDDLDVRASDLLQTNAVVWVEGPSDRIYFNKWIELWSHSQLLEGVHYQCLMLGGSCNAHVTFESPDIAEDMIQGLKINRNVIVLVDSDIKNEGEQHKEHTRRIAEEVEKVFSIGWITDAKEVENYIPLRVLRLVVDDDALAQPDRFTNVVELIQQQPKKKSITKVEIAKRVVEELRLEDLATAYDLSGRLAEVCAKIRAWNRLDAPAVSAVAATV